MFLLINFYSYMFRPQCLAIFRELINLCILYVNFFGTGLYIYIYIYIIKVIIKIELKY